MKVDFIKLGLSGLMLTTLLNPLSTMALSTSTPIQAKFDSTPIDVSVPNSIEITNVAGKTNATIPEYTIANNSKVGVITVSNINIVKTDSWDFASYDTDFNKLSIESNKFAISYKNHDMQTSYTTPQAINPQISLSMNLNGKTSIRSSDTQEKIANMIVTLGYVEEVYLDTLKVVYTEQPDSVTNINPDHLKVTAVYTDGTEKILSTSDYTLTPLTGNGEETVKVTYTEKGVTKEAVFIVNNPYTVTLISDGSTDQKISYKFGTGTTLPIPSRDGYTFKGWFANNIFEGDVITQIDNTSKANKTFHAKWEKITSELVNTSEFRNRLGQYTNKTVNLSFIQGKSIISDPVAIIDLSSKSDNSIVATVVNNTTTSGTYNITVQSEGSILAPNDCTGMFKGSTFYSEPVSIYFEKLEAINFSNFDTSNVTNMDNFLFGCKKLKSIQGFENFNTSKVTNMGNMFNYNFELASIPGLDSWDVSNVTDMRQMFTECYKLSLINNIENWETSKVTNMKFMFYGCPEIKSFDVLEKWDISKVTDKSNMFGNCSATPPSWYAE